MNNYERIKQMNISDLAGELVELQLNVMYEIQKTLVYCLPLPKEKEIEKLREDTIKALLAECE